MAELSFLIDKGFEPSQSGFISLPQSFQSLEVGDSQEVKFLEAGLAIKKKHIDEFRKELDNKELFSKYVQNPFDSKILDEVINSIGKTTLKNWTYFIAKYEYKEGNKKVTFAYLLPRNFDENNSKCVITRKPDNKDNQKVFDIV